MHKTLTLQQDLHLDQLHCQSILLTYHPCFGFEQLLHLHCLRIPQMLLQLNTITITHTKKKQSKVYLISTVDKNIAILNVMYYLEYKQAVLIILLEGRNFLININ